MGESSDPATSSSNSRTSSSTSFSLARGDLAFTFAVFVVALLPRLFVAIAWSKEPVWDGYYYHFGAERLASGFGYSEDVLVGGHLLWKPWIHYPVGYSALLGAAYFLFGSGLLVAPVLNAIVGSLGVACAHRVARYAFPKNRARLAAGLLAIHPGLIAYSALVMTEIIAGALLLFALLVAVKWRGRWQGAVFYGVILGGLALIRPVSLLALPLWFLFESGSWRGVLARGVAVGACAGAMILPWTLRNCARMDGCALISTNGGWNLAIGALTDSGRFVTLKGSDGCANVTGQVQQDRCWAKVGWQRIRSAPARWLTLAPKKLEQTYNHESFAVESLREADPRTWNEPRRVAARELLTGFHRWLLVMAALISVRLVVHLRPLYSSAVTQLLLLLGTALFVAFAAASDEHPFYLLPAVFPLFALLPLPGAPRRTHVEYWLLAVVLLTSLTHVLFFGEDRYHLVLSPVFCLLAAGALRFGTRSERPAQTT